MEGLAKIAFDNIHPESDERWNRLNEKVQEREQAVQDARAQMDPELLRKQDNVELGGFATGGILGAVAAPVVGGRKLYQGATEYNQAIEDLGDAFRSTEFPEALKKEMEHLKEYRPVKRPWLAGAGGALLGLGVAPLTGLIGGGLGLAAVNPIAKHYANQQDPEKLQALRHSQTRHMDAQDRLSEYENLFGR